MPLRPPERAQLAGARCLPPDAAGLLWRRRGPCLRRRAGRGARPCGAGEPRRVPGGGRGPGPGRGHRDPTCWRRDARRAVGGEGPVSASATRRNAARLVRRALRTAPGRNTTGVDHG
ncbi:MAG: hypothetical protein F4X36_21900 [Gammaproteobacteria bacterium]|nr:hypothetical protein [Gammaproteobacteria bacterium]